MAAINPNALSKFAGILEVAPIATPTLFQRLASVRGLVGNFDNTVNQVEINADDTGTVFKGYLPEARIEGSFLENADRDVMQLLMGGTATDVAGTIVSGATQTLSSGAWDVNQFYVIDNQNGDGSIVVINSVTGSVDGALAVNDDYDLVKDPLTGKYGIVLQDVASATTLTTIVQDIVIDYDYTPNATESLALNIVFTESPRVVVRITATQDVTGKTRIITLSDATFDGVYGLEFLDIVEAGDLTGATFTFKATKGSIYTVDNQII